MDIAQLFNTPSEPTAHHLITHLIDSMEQVIKGKRAQLEMVLTCLIAKGHVLMEDNPGTGKTVMARTLAHAISGQDNTNVLFKRIQFTPDLLPMDLIGAHIFDDKNLDFIFKKGPLFSNILLADEINRASPKVQSALLECMAEGQITVGDHTYKLEDLFFTIATQNPIEMEGTYPLPAAQLDRFFMKIYFGYVDEATELEIYHSYNNINKQLQHMQQVITLPQVLQLQKDADAVFIHEAIVQAISNIVRNTRSHTGIQLGASTRAGITFIKCIKAYAMVKGRTYVIEDDIKDLAFSVLHHRLIFKNRATQQQILDEIITAEMQQLRKMKIHHS
jgi:MoxR-like ATPase